MTDRPFACVICGGQLAQQPLGRVRLYCSGACRVRAQRRRPRPLVSELVGVGVDAEVLPTPRVSTEQQVQRALMEARAVTFALLRLGDEATPALAWRCERLGRAFEKALLESFGEVGR